MTLHTNRPTPPTHVEARRPAFPLENQASSLFLGWGPKI
jgi:hypothetical protein